MNKPQMNFRELAKEFAGINFALLIAATLAFGGYVFVRNMITLIAP